MIVVMVELYDVIFLTNILLTIQNVIKTYNQKICRLSERQPIKTKRLSKTQPIEFLWIRDQSYLQHY